jgi:prephenate dehydrogenase
MGGSLARAVRALSPAIRIVAVEPREAVRARALAERVVDEAIAAPGPALAGCDLTVICTPVAAIEPLLAPISKLLADGAILTDVGGAKERLVQLARTDVRGGVRFVGAHPMFGGQGGYEGAKAELWKGGAVAVCTDGDAEAVARVADFHEALGATAVRCTAAEHDAAVAMVSHLPYLLASALAAAAEAAGPLARRLAGPGLRDTTRLAAFPFDIQGEVARRNAHIPGAAVKLEIQLQRILAAITASPEAARQALESARVAREAIFPSRPEKGEKR